MKVSPDMREKVIEAAQNSKKEIIGLDELKNDAHAETFLGIIKAFGNNSSGFIYIEANLPKNTNRPADIILCDPNTGVLVIEVKGFTLNMIDRVVAGTKFNIFVKNKLQFIDPWDQARTVMFNIQNEFKKKFPTTIPPWFSYLIAFPYIREDEWKSDPKKFNIAFDEVIFLNDLQNISILKNKIMDRRILHGGTRRIEKPIEAERIEKIKELFGDSAVLYKKRVCREVKKLSLGDEIDRLEALDKYLSKEQQELSDLEVDGKPRLIRGVAGSGKTVVLANMIARYIKHLKRQGKQSEFDFEDNLDEDVKIAIICYNKTLVSLLKEKIAISYKNQTGEDLNWDDFIFVRNFDALLNKIFVQKGIIDGKIWEIGNVEGRSKFLSDEWEKYKNNNINWDKVTKFDAIFVDEGQDLSEVEYALLKDLLKPNSQNIIIFYDDAQNVYARSRPNWINAGINITPDRSKVMKTCFRNTKQIITLAYNVLLGSCADENAKVRTRTYSDINYLKKTGLVDDYGEWIRVNFALRDGATPVFKKLDTEEEELNWVVETVKKLIKEEKVRPEDILIITYRNKYCERLSEKLNKGIPEIKIINSYKKEEKNAIFFEENTLTISTIHGAKGYDAPIVFLIALDDFSTDCLRDVEEDRKNKYESECRALFYVGATRAKYLLYLSGVDDHPNLLIKEIEKTHKMLMEKGAYNSNNVK